ncbi:MAG: winged helix-turn-helix domain-containing protein [Solirubrobacteraceae bacterium]
MRPYEDITDPRLAKALAHPIRTRVLSALEGRTASPSDLATELDVSLGVLSYHVRRLSALGFIKLVKRVPRRGAVEHYYTATARPRITDSAWGSMPSVAKDATVGAALEQVGTAVVQAAGDGGFDAANSHLARTRVSVDPQGWDELADELAGLQKRIREIEVESKRRLRANRGGEGSPRQEASVVMMLFHSAVDGAAKASSNGGAPKAPRKKRATAKA